MNKTSIEWTDYTWNTTSGCTHVSDGCKFCYAEALSLRFGRSKNPWIKPFETENVKLHPDRLMQPFLMKAPARIFVDSMSDLFHELIPLNHIAKVFAVMAATPELTYQILTKRPERMAQVLGAKMFRNEAIPGAALELGIECDSTNDWSGSLELPLWPLPNVWLGTSVEDQRVVDRIDWLVSTPAVVRFLSCEPLIGWLDISACFSQRDYGPTYEYYRLATGISDPTPITIKEGVDWVIVGGESGPNHRPIDPDWVRSLRDQCVDAGVPFFFKQWGGRTPKAGGRELDGMVWDEFPLEARS